MLAQVVEFIISGVSCKPFIHGIWPWERNLHVKIKLSLFFTFICQTITDIVTLGAEDKTSKTQKLPYRSVLPHEGLDIKSEYEKNRTKRCTLALYSKLKI